MAKLKLRELYKISSGGTPLKSNDAYYNGGDIKWVKTGDLKEKYLIDCEECITEVGLKHSSAKMYEPNTVLVAMYGATIGETSILKIRACTNQACAAFTPTDKVIPEYLYYFFKSKKERFVKDGVGGAQPNISAGYLRNVEMDLISISEQHNIVELFKKTENIINNRRRQLKKLNQLIKSRFIEMFGDSVNNASKWEKKTIESVCNDIYGGGTPSKSHQEYYKGTIPWVTPKDMKTIMISNSQDHITEEAIAQSTTKLIPKNSVLMVIRSGILKRSLPVAINTVDVTINQDMKAFLPSENIMPEYLLYTFKQLDRSILSKVRAVTADNIEFSELKCLEIIIPPLELQNQFASFTKQVDKSKLAIQKSLDKLEILQKSLMQQYFG